MTDKTISYALFTRRPNGDRVRKHFELRVEESAQGYTLVRQLDDESVQHPEPMRTEKSYWDLNSALSDFEHAVASISAEGSYVLREFSHANTAFNAKPTPLAAAY